MNNIIAFPQHVGKTVTSIAQYNASQSEPMLVIHFSDGSSLEISAEPWTEEDHYGQAVACACLHVFEVEA